MDPCAVAELQYCQLTGDPDKDEDLIDMYGPLKLDKADLILMPVNDNSNPLLISNISIIQLNFSIDAGTHWTLLIFHNGTWWYFDSSSATVPSNVRKLAENTSKLMGK